MRKRRDIHINLERRCGMLFFPSYRKLLPMRKGRASFHDSPPDLIGEASREGRASHVALKASLTLEASIVLPIFVMAIMVLIFYLQAIQMQVQIQKALFNQTVKTAGYAYYLSQADMQTEAEQFLETEYIKLNIIKELGDGFFSNGYIINGKNGLLLNLSNIKDEGVVDVALQYRMQVPFDIFGVGKLNFVARARCRTWDGKYSDITGSQGNLVYVTPYGEVYHRSRECTYITNSINSCYYAVINEKRNLSGGIYYPCKRCAEVNFIIDTQPIFYTDYGARYHLTALCANLKNNVFAISEDVAKEKYRACSKCN